MMSNRKQFTVTREMLTAVASDQSVQLKVKKKVKVRWPDFVAGIPARFSKFAFVLFAI